MVIRFQFRLMSMVGLLALVAASACQAATALPASSPSPAAVLTETRPVPTQTSTNIPLPTLTASVTPSFAPTPSPTLAQPVYAALSPENVHLLTPIGDPFVVAPRSAFGIDPWIVQVIFRADNTWVVTPRFPGSRPPEIQVRDLESGEPVANLVDKTGGNKNIIELLIPSPDGRFLAMVSPDTSHISLWDMDRLEKKIDLAFKGYLSTSWGRYPMALAGSFSSDGKYLAVAGCRQAGVPCLSAGVTVYDVDSGKIVTELIGHQSYIVDIQFQPGTWLLAMAGQGEPLRDTDLLVWDVEKNEKVAEISMERERNIEEKITFNSAGSVLVGFVRKDLWMVDPPADPQSLTFWDTKTWTITSEMPVKERCANFTFIPGTTIFAYTYISGNPPNRLLFAEAGGTTPIVKLVAPLNAIDSIFASPDGRFIYTYSMIGSIYDVSGDMPEFVKAIGPHIQRWGVPEVPANSP